MSLTNPQQPPLLPLLSTKSPQQLAVFLQTAQTMTAILAAGYDMVVIETLRSLGAALKVTTNATTGELSYQVTQ